MSEQKRVTDLTTDELRKVFDANTELQNDVHADMVESEDFWIGEQIDYIKTSLTDWSIGSYGRSYIHVSHDYDDISRFIDGLRKIQTDYCGMPDDWNTKIDELERLYNEWGEASHDYEDYYDIETSALDYADELADELARHYDKTYEWLLDHDNQAGYFVEFFATERLDDSAYIDENYVLYTVQVRRWA